MALANMKFDPKKDSLFFTYLRRLRDANEIQKVEVVGRGPQLLQQFVTGKASITMG